MHSRHPAYGWWARCEGAPLPTLWRSPSVRDALDLTHRVGLAVDREQRRGLRQVDGIDHALDLGRDRHRVARGIRRGGGQRIGAVRPLRAVIALAVPAERLVGAGGHRIIAAANVLAGGI